MNWLRDVGAWTLARIEPETFMVTLAGLDPDRDWTVRSAIASSLGSLPGEQTLARVRVMLQDRDTRVVAAVVGAVALTVLPELFRGLADYRYIFYGLALLAVIRFRPQGLLGSI